jgi:hypothetical protein
MKYVFNKWGYFNCLELQKTVGMSLFYCQFFKKIHVFQYFIKKGF